MHVCVPLILKFLSQKRRRGPEDVKTEVEETPSEGKPSSSHAADPYAPLYAQVAVRDAQTE